MVMIADRPEESGSIDDVGTFFSSHVPYPAIATDQVKEGSYSVKVEGSASGGASWRNFFRYWPWPGTGDLYLRMWMRVGSLTNAAGVAIVNLCRPYELYDPSPTLILGSDGTITFHVVGDSIGDHISTGAITAGQWHLLDLWVRAGDPGGRVQLKLDGVTVIDETGELHPYANIAIGQRYAQYHASPGPYWFDSIQIDTVPIVVASMGVAFRLVVS